MVSGGMADCPVEKECLEWVHRYLKDCICSFRDEISLGLGLLSVLSWGIAEVPQIITNFREKSTEGVSLAFLMTWVVGDIFNLTGCYLEPATLPTQFIMALLYTFTTIILVLQTIYYDYIYTRRNSDEGYEKIASVGEKPKTADVDTVKKHSEQDNKTHEGGSSPSSSPPTTIINVPITRRASRGSESDVYYMSARSLASSHAPGIGSYMVGSRDRESGGSSGNHSFLRTTVSSSPQHSSVSRSSATQAGSLLRTAASSVLLVGSVAMTSTVLSGAIPSTPHNGPAKYFVFTGRRLLQQISVSHGRYSTHFPRRSFLGEEAVGPWGEIFGWCMAAIYMGGRLPQIHLNIRRGTVEGLNPLMFVFALVGNATYVGSILVRSILWVTIKPNLPWLVDAAVCVLLDLFILCQFFYYSTRKVDDGSDDDSKDQKEASK
ncbi:solute carrier family 66 (lysosomal lysine-arginine transporter), member 1 [Marchantia polymorpha subsp. ruderalis]|uniref:Uncharacterized protein n=2 Tax=Marchantia polymorpha TaxID=3197 RepID=A0AAF6AMU4_MARPO|nr:hypothetical protein MARPO_0036s0057 [Marchantia polymorpha]BBM97764.1 hypothetical protein Mp_1g08130 [Marchantia polymorpha subsp. ruderalis]|eukprot:PTQ41067.1 hypothetical protein MARPO_0036s0057 [Marchantia polymorpha]